MCFTARQRREHSRRKSCRLYSNIISLVQEHRKLEQRQRQQRMSASMLQGVSFCDRERGASVNSSRPLMTSSERHHLTFLSRRAITKGEVLLAGFGLDLQSVGRNLASRWVPPALQQRLWFAHPARPKPNAAISNINSSCYPIAMPCRWNEQCFYRIATINRAPDRAVAPELTRITTHVSRPSHLMWTDWMDHLSRSVLSFRMDITMRMSFSGRAYAIVPALREWIRHTE